MILLVLICIIFFFRIIKCTPQGAFVASDPARPFLRPRSSPSVHAMPRQGPNSAFMRAPAPSAKEKPSVGQRMTSRSRTEISHTDRCTWPLVPNGTFFHHQHGEQRPKDCLFPDISLQTLYLLRKICPPLHPILDFFFFRSLYHIESV